MQVKRLLLRKLRQMIVEEIERCRRHTGYVFRRVLPGLAHVKYRSVLGDLGFQFFGSDRRYGIGFKTRLLPRIESAGQVAQGIVVPYPCQSLDGLFCAAYRRYQYNRLLAVEN